MNGDLVFRTNKLGVLLNTAYSTFCMDIQPETAFPLIASNAGELADFATGSIVMPILPELQLV